MRQVRRCSLLLLSALAISGCTTTAYQSELIQQPPSGERVIAVGPITAKDDALWQSYAVLVQSGLVAELSKLGDPNRVIAPGPGRSVPTDAITVTGDLTEFDKGNVALRWIIGFGAGRSRAVGRFQITNPDGGVVMQFTTTKEYAGGAGMGGADWVDADTLAQQLGEKAADAIHTWLKTGKLL